MAVLNIYPQPRLVEHGLDSLMLYLAEQPSPAGLAMQQRLISILQQAFDDSLIELVPSYISLFIWFDPLRVAHDTITQLVRQSWNACLLKAAEPSLQSKRVELPCYYALETGADLLTLAQQKQLSVTELIDLHSAQVYQVYAIGFAPGFAYLGFVDPRLATARHHVPRTRVPAGSVALADRQTAVYPAASPGGWQLLGRCPLPLFSLERQPVMPFSVGDQVQFVPVDRAEYLRLGGEL